MKTLINDAYTSFVQEFEREPRIEELGELLDMSPKEIYNVLLSDTVNISNDSLEVNEGSNEITSDEVSREEMIQNLEILSEREKMVISNYYGLEGYKLSIEEIGEALGLSREGVYQIKNRAIRRLRKSYNLEGSITTSNMISTCYRKPD